MNSRIELPPSPPASTSNKSSPVALPTSPILTPPPDVARTLSLSPTPGSSPLCPLPREVFLLTMNYLPAEEIPRLCLVNRAWSSFLNREPQLWPQPRIDLERNQVHEIERWINRVSVNRPDGPGVRDLEISLGFPARRLISADGSVEDVDDSSVIRDRLDHLISALDYACLPHESDEHGQIKLSSRPSTLRSIRIVVRPKTMTSLWVLHIFAHAAHMPLFRQLRSVEIHTRTEFRLAHHPFSIWPSLATFRVIVHQDEHTPAPRISQSFCISPINEVVPKANETLECYNLCTLHWANVLVNRTVVWPTMPNLTTLYLSDVTWEGLSLFYLLRLARKSLVTIHIANLRLEELDDGDEYQDWHDNVHVHDEALIDGHIFPEEAEYDDENFDTLEPEDPAPIIFPRLRHLHVSGESTPALFATIESYDETDFEEAANPSPHFVMPELQVATLEDVLTEDPSSDEAYATLTVLGRNAPNLLELNLHTTCASDSAVFQCLAGMNSRMRRLTLYDTNVTDWLFTSLPKLVPRLEYLDVRGCADVTIQGVARFVEVMRDQSEGKYRVSTVFVDPPEWADAELYAWKWLEWVSVLGYDEWSYEGMGPTDPTLRRRWRVSGKEDSMKGYRKKLAEKEAAERQQAALQHQLRQAQAHSHAHAQGSGTDAHRNVAQAHSAQAQVQALAQEMQARSALQLALGSPYQHPHLAGVPSVLQQPHPQPFAQPHSQAYHQPTVDPRLAPVKPTRTASDP